MVGLLPPLLMNWLELTRRAVGKQWHIPKAAFRPKVGNTSYEKRNAQRIATEAMKAKERQMKEEKESEKQVRRYCLF